VDLRGAEGERLDPCAVLAGFLRALGIDGSVIPTDLDELMALYRARAVDRRVLVVLDNAANEAQVRPLLPSGPECAALVTSRAPLGGLEGARHIPLDVLPTREALDLLSKVAGPRRVAAEPEAAAEIVRLCGSLPLAVRIAGARLAARPRWRLDTFATRLADERHRLDELRVGDLEVRASVALSYRALDAEARRGFRFLAVLDAPDLTAWLAGALLRKRAHDAEALLERLVDAHLLESLGDDGTLPVRYRLHGLVRLFARELLEEEEDGEARRLAALARALGAQLALAEQARVALSPGDAALVLGGEAVRWLVDHEVVDLVVRDPLAWFEAERPSMLASVIQACRTGLHGAAWELAASLSTFFAIRGHWDDWRSTHQLVIRSTRDAGDRRGELQAGFLLADSHLWFGDVVSAQPLLERCLVLAEELGDELGDAMCQFGLALAATLQGDVETADDRQERALAYFERTGNRHGRALVLAVRGLLLRMQDRCGDAVASLREALATFVGEGDRQWEAISMMWLADVHAQAGAMADAVRCLERCIRGFDGLGNRQFAAMGRFRLVEIRLPLISEDEAVAGLSECARVFAELGMRSNEARALQLLASRRPERATLL
jgi:tetratricopeptide (TPR) repeat protein